MSEHNSASYRKYILGFILSLILTLVPYYAVTHGVSSKLLLGAILAIAAISQVYVQLYYFLHLGQEAKPRWKAYSLYFAVMILVILVFGSLWVMNNLNYNMMPDSNVTPAVQQDEKIKMPEMEHHQ